jgi:cytochrome c
MKRIEPLFPALLLLALASAPVIAADAERGAQVFQSCASCHSTAPGVQLTGPSLSHVWGHRAGSVAGFDRYSKAMKQADVVWTETTLDRWLTDPAAFIPGTSMTFPGLRDRNARADVIAYLKAVSQGTAPANVQQRGGMMAAPARPDLKQAPPKGRVVEIRHCKDTYSIKTADGAVDKVWEFNLRFKTDSSKSGPEPNKPVIVGAGMQGDRASIVFAAPGEISRFVKESCD